eukprot:CAMPEP_0194582298 /NCGR_PEP_ID=MMETSP0292-20121207/15496_1 /TAXON_ID=39354 /ORGANISM="Heterosigma akashiwo, Strain CCMP2393" /LENGTH=86 /DNA_ID=CAMNT_0039436373 /DNA_START=33 /DNA_END=293 /DNA_ORIENTATION=+
MAKTKSKRAKSIAPKKKVTKVSKIHKTGSTMRSGRLHLAKTPAVHNPNKPKTSKKKLNKLKKRQEKHKIKEDATGANKEERKMDET